MDEDRIEQKNEEEINTLDSSQPTDETTDQVKEQDEIPAQEENKKQSTDEETKETQPKFSIDDEFGNDDFDEKAKQYGNDHQITNTEEQVNNFDEDRIKWEIPSEKEIYIKKLEEKKMEQIKSKPQKEEPPSLDKPSITQNEDILWDNHDEEISDAKQDFVPFLDSSHDENPTLSIKRGIASRKFYQIDDDIHELVGVDDSSDEEKESNSFFLKLLCCNFKDDDDEEDDENSDKLATNFKYNNF